MHHDLTLVADIGGTHTRIALARAGALLPGSIARYRNDRFESLEQVLAADLAERSDRPDRLCLALAGVVGAETARMTNLGWHVEARSLARLSGARQVTLLNDLQAQGHALPALPAAGLGEIRPGRPRPGGCRMVVGLGTGFNIALVHDGPGGLLVPPAEAGHADLPLRSAADLELAAWLRAETGGATVEAALCGPGLTRLDRWCGDSGGAGRAPAEVLAALEAGEARARAAVRLFAERLGHVIGNLALIGLPEGGIFLTGGLARAVAPHLCAHGFAEALLDRGAFADIVAPIPVLLIEDDGAALTGCARFAARDAGGGVFTPP